MKLKNKKTGEIAVLTLSNNGETLIIMKDGDMLAYDVKLSNLKEWEDYEEPKESEHYWYIGYKNDIRRTKYHHISDFADNQVTATRKEIGNCFESLEEAEKALEKLKAWKRLREKGFSIDGYTNDIGDNYYMPSDFVIKLNYNGDHRKSYPYDVFKDLDLLFGGDDEL